MSQLSWPNTERIAHYSATCRYEDLPLKAIATAKTIVLDTMAALFAAWPTRHPVSRLLGDWVVEMGGTPESTVLGYKVKVPAANAALVNGTMGYAADIEGGGIARMHAAAVFVPTVLVMAERQHLDGRALITALALAYDVAARVSNSCATAKSYPHSFHPSALFGTFGAAAITGYALRLDTEAFIHAYGLAGNVASGLMSWLDDPSEHSRSYGIGVAARNGVTAALLAGRGFGGPKGIFDAMKYNIFDAFSGEMHLAELTRDLGRDFYIEQADGFKQYPCCGDIHSGLDALLAILTEESVEVSQIASITHYVRPERHAVIDNNPLRSHNAQYIMAVAAVNRTIQWDDFLEDRRTQPEIQALWRKVRLEKSTDLDRSSGAAPAIVEVKTVTGQRYHRRVDFAEGRTQNPLNPTELEQKFVRWATTVVDEGRAKQIIQVVNRLEELSDASDLVSLMHNS